MATPVAILPSRYRAYIYTFLSPSRISSFTFCLVLDFTSPAVRVPLWIHVSTRLCQRIMNRDYCYNRVETRQNSNVVDTSGVQASCKQELHYDRCTFSSRVEKTSGFPFSLEKSGNNKKFNEFVWNLWLSPLLIATSEAKWKFFLVHLLKLNVPLFEKRISPLEKSQNFNELPIGVLRSLFSVYLKLTAQ